MTDTLTDHFVDFAQLPASRLSPQALGLAKFSLLDWMACGTAATEEPLAWKLRQMARTEEGAEMASVIDGPKVPARMAALVNAAISHALDYDDTHFGHIGHLSVGIYPAALAVGEEQGKRAAEVVEAFVIGAEAAIRIGMVLGSAHYNLGFHQTATAGAFGATIAAGRLYGLQPAEMRHALGLCATRASGLKSQFGTMGKPYNAGIAAANGVEAAQLARLGFTSADDGLMGAQGFVETHTPAANPADGWNSPPPDTFLFENNKYKLHACCHGTHAMIAALLDQRAAHVFRLEDIDTVELRTNPRWMRVCNLKAPRTGLEVKFSYAWLAGMALRGDRTGDDRIYTDAIASDAALAAFARKVTVIADASIGDMQAEGVIRCSDGASVSFHHDLDTPLPLDVLGRKLREKAEAILGERGHDLWTRFAALEEASAKDLGAWLRGSVVDT